MKANRWTGLALLCALPVHAEELGCLSTTFRFLGANDKVCVEVFDDPKVPGVSCHISQARTGGITGPLGLADDPSRFGIACQQTGPIALSAELEDEEEVFSADTSILFKETQVHRLYDRKRNALVYMAISTKIVKGSPMNSISTVPIMRWNNSVEPRVSRTNP
ncbi:MAG: CreA family protein [Pseudomonadota bacterium]|nr:CreA family protein [Pseudomonadota bacterium]